MGYFTQECMNYIQRSTMLDGIVFADSGSAEDVICEMQRIIDSYGFITVSDVYDIAGLGLDTTYEMLLYGWDNLKHVRAARIRDGYIIVIEKEKRISCGCTNSQDHKVKYVDYSKLKGSSNYESQDQMVSHPSHYQSKNGIETIDVIEAFTEDLEGIEAVDTANVIKYISRWKKKNGVQDLEKAMWYLQHLINHTKKENEQS